MIKVGRIVQIRECKTNGLSKAATARALGIDRKTVAKYWEGSSTDPELPRYKQRRSLVEPYHEYIIKRLTKWPELSAERIYQEIKEMGYAGSRRTVRRYVASIRPKHMREYMPFETLPGQQAQVDWGSCGEIVENGRKRKLYAFVFCLSWSRLRYTEFVTSLNMATFMASMHRAFHYVGGVPTEIVFDNAKTVVSERVGTVVRFNENLLRMALEYNFTPKACWVSDPESKGKVESNVKYVKRGFLYGREYRDLEDLNGQALDWCNKIANAKVHDTTHEVPWDRHREELLYLQPLPQQKSTLYVSECRKATKTSLISIDGVKYSVPAQLAGKKVTYRRYENRIEVLLADGNIEPICLVQWSNNPVINKDHYPAHQNKGSKTKHPLQTKFESLAPEAAEYLQGLSRKRVGHLKEQMEKIVSLAANYDHDELSQAMSRSIKYGAFSYASLKRILEKQQRAPKSLPKIVPKPSGSLPLATHSVDVPRRDPAYYERWA